MKKKLLNSMRVLLVAAGLCVGATSAWADTVNATLNHTAGNSAGSRTEGVNSVDCVNGNGSVAGEFFNAASGSWQGWAFADFSFTIPAGHSITSATLTYSIHMGDNKNRTYNLYYLNSGISLSSTDIASNIYSSGTSIYDFLLHEQANKELTAHTACSYDGNKTQITVSDNALTQATKNFTQDVTTAVQAIYTAGQSNIIFQWAASSSYSYLHGKGKTDAPTLVITTSSETLYTASFTANSGAITPTVTIYSDAARTSAVSNGTLRDGVTYYYRAVLHGYENYEGSFTVSAANPSESFTMTALTPIASLAVKAKIGASTYDIKTIELDDKYEGDEVTFNYPRYFLVGTSLYEVSQSAHSGGYYSWTYTLDGDNAEVEYNTLVSNNVVYYAEGEDILTSATPTNAGVRCSDGKGGYFTTANNPMTLKNLAAGRYKVQSHTWGSAGTTYKFKIGGIEVSTIATTGALNSSTSWFVVDAASDITLEANENNSGRVLDCVYIEKYDTYVYNGDFSNPTWNAGWSGTGSNKKDAFISNTNAWFDGKFAEMWAGGSTTTFSTEANLRQTIKALPAGTYILSANIVNNVESSGGVLYAKVGENPEVSVDAAGLSEVTPKSVVFSVGSTSDVVIGFKTTGITGGTGWIALDDFSLADGVISVSITDAGAATLVSPYALNFTGIESVKAYYASAQDAQDGKNVTFTRIEGTVAANTPLYVTGTTTNVPVVATGDAVAGNLLVAGTGAAVAYEAGGNYNFILNKVGEDVGFYKANGKTVATGKAYLSLPSDPFANGAKSLNLIFDGETTGISDITRLNGNGESMNDMPIYNLSGQRIAAPQKGINIVNGKKFIVK